MITPGATRYSVASTRLASTSGAVALAQCEDLMNNVVPAVRGSSHTIGMNHTDHDGWFVALTAP